MVFGNLGDQPKPPKGQGGVVGDAYICYEIERNKAPRLAEWLNEMDANGYELAALEGYGAGSVYLMAIVRRKSR